MSQNHYKTPQAFRQSLDDRLRKRSTETGESLVRLRQLVVMDRLAVRLCGALGERVIITGAMALLYRDVGLRTTRDLDVRAVGDPETLLGDLQRAARRDLGDFLSFEVRLHPRHPAIDGPAVVYEGQRFQVSARMGGKPYGDPFGLDVGLGDPLARTPDEVPSRDYLVFAGIEPTSLNIYPRETHLAEKLHAYTVPRDRPNTRLRDLPDMATLATIGAYTASEVRDVIEQVFSFRGTHPVPACLPDPPEDWSTPYARLAAQEGLPWTDLASVTMRAREFLDPVLSGDDGVWDAESQEWRGS